MKRQITSSQAPKAFGPFSQAIAVGNTVYISGQIGINPADGTLAEDVASQAHQAIDNLRGILKAAQMDLSDVVKTTVYLQSMDDFSAINAIYADCFSEPFPARACFQVGRLPNGAKFEIEAVAIN